MKELQPVLNLCKELGYNVYIPESGLSTYFYYTDKTNIGYVQYNHVGGYSVSTVHKPSKDAGSGYQVANGCINSETLRLGFNVVSARVEKYKSWDEFEKSRKIIFLKKLF